MCVVTLRSFQDIADDPALPTLGMALRPALAEPALMERLSGVVPASSWLRSIDVRAYKPGRRCLIEYELSSPFGAADGAIAVLGKIRANRFGNSGYRQLDALWKAGFDDASADAISVPEPLGTVPTLRMWLQRKVPGTPATEHFDGADSLELADRIARAVHKLHTSGVGAGKRHTMDDELRILTRCLDDVATLHPDLETRARRLIDTCVRVGGLLPTPSSCSSHRDFYGDQVLVADARLYLLDFDLFCDADPGLDVGNFIGHVTEHALRVFGDPRALEAFERRLEDRFVELAGENVRWAVHVYAALTIARHVFLSTRFSQRSHLTVALLEIARQRLQRAAAEGGMA